MVCACPAQANNKTTLEASAKANGHRKVANQRFIEVGLGFILFPVRWVGCGVLLGKVKNGFSVYISIRLTPSLLLVGHTITNPSHIHAIAHGKIANPWKPPLGNFVHSLLCPIIHPLMDFRVPISK